MDVKPVTVTSPPTAAPARKGIICKMANYLSRHTRLAAAMIIVLTMLVIAMFVGYHGVWKFGPYWKGRKMEKKGKPRPKNTDEGQEDERGDEETEKLIDSINQT